MKNNPLDIAIAGEGIFKTFRNDDGKALAVLRDVSLDIGKGELFVLLGPSGCGKSTLLRILSGLEKEYTGKVTLGEGLTKEDFSFVFQQFALLPWLTVRENIVLGLDTRIPDQKERESMVAAQIERLGLTSFRDSYPRELSGGMRQRVGIARALARKPKIIFMDEPFSSLDSFIAKKLREDLLALWQEEQPAIVMVTHNIEEAVQLGDRIAVMTTRPGTIEKTVTNDLPRPRGLRTPEFFAMEDELYALVDPSVAERSK